jgi:hypothetical protein
MISAHEGKVSDDQILQTRLLAKESVVIGPSINKMASKVAISFANAILWD